MFATQAPIASAQMERSEAESGSYFSQVPKRSGTSHENNDAATTSHVSEHAYTFRHFPAEGGQQSFDSRPIHQRQKSPDDIPQTQHDESYIPYQIQEKPNSNPGAEGEMTVIQEIEIQAPQPLIS